MIKLRKGAWGMSRHQKAKKGVENCEKLRVAVKRAVIRRYPIEVFIEYIDRDEPTWRTETSKYPEEEKEKSIP